MSDSIMEHKKSNCHFCGYQCGLIVGVREGRVVSLEPDVSRYPYDEGIMKTCVRWKKNLDVIDAPDRINYPLKRVGARGGNQWERVTWDEALDDIAQRLRALADEHGPQTLASSIGGPHASYWPLHRFMSLFGSPNNMGIGQICWNPHIWTDSITFGWPLEIAHDYDETTALFLWGTNPAESDNSLFWRSILQLKKNNIPLIVVDSRTTKTTQRANLHLMIRPATDHTLALGMINTIIANDWHDKEFINRWCKGFDELVEHVKPYTSANAAAVCGVAEADVIEAARLFAQGNATALLSGRGLDQLGKNTNPTHRSLAILRAITGNVDKPGACVLNVASDFIPEVDLEMSSLFTPEQRATSLNKNWLSLQTYDGYEKVNEHTKRLGRSLPMRYLTSAHPDLVWNAALTGRPYPVKALFVMGCNPVLTYGDSHKVYDAIMAMDLVVVLEYYLTSTAQLADYVLPSAGALERPLFQQHGGVANIAYGGPAAVEPYYERHADYDFFRDLGIRLGQEEHWPDKTLAEAFATTLSTTHMSWEEFCEVGTYYYHPGFFKHEMLDPKTDQPQGFGTASGKIELASDVLDELGHERLPVGQLASEYCPSSLTLITGARIQPFYASSYFQDREFRALHPFPFAEVSEKTAHKHGLAEGDTVVISTAKGQARFKLAIHDMADDVISAEYGWWYPESPAGAPDLSGSWRSNINSVTSADVEDFDHLVGTWVYNGIECSVKRVEEDLPEWLG